MNPSVKLALCSVIAFFVMTEHVQGKTYYIGSDISTNDYSDQKFITLAQANKINFLAGDTILLSGDIRHYGTLELIGVKGTKNAPITITSTGGKRAIIDAKSCNAAIMLIDCSYINISNIELTADGESVIADDSCAPLSRSGVYVGQSAKGNSVCQGIVLDNLYIHDVYYFAPNVARLTAIHEKNWKPSNAIEKMHCQRWGYGILVEYKRNEVNDMVISNCEIERVSARGIYATFDGNGYGLNNFVVKNNIIKESGGPGIKLRKSRNAIISGCKVYNSGCSNDLRNSAVGTGIYTGNSIGSLIEYNYVTGACGEGDSRGIHLDRYSIDCVVQYNVSVANQGGFAHIVGGSRNSIFRYNLSINDGWRDPKDGVPGDVISFIGGSHNGDVKDCYVYNNTIYSDVPTTRLRSLTDVKNILCVNNIIYVCNKFELTPGKTRINSKTNVDALNFIFENNMISVEPPAPFSSAKNIIGDPQFANAGSENIEDYTASSPMLYIKARVVQPFKSKSKKHKAPKSKNHATGEVIGRQITTDILGNEIDPTTPFIGAIMPMIK